MKDGTVLLLPEEIALLLQGQFINAIKAVRARAALGLKEAKDSCDAYRDVIREHRESQAIKVRVLITLERQLSLKREALEASNAVMDAARAAWNTAYEELQQTQEAARDAKYSLGVGPEDSVR